MMLLYPLILFVLLQLHLLSAFPVLKRPFHAEKSSTTRNFKIAETMEQNQPAEAVGGHNGLMNPFHDPEPGLADSLQPDEDTDEEDGSHYQIHLVQPDRTLLSHTVFHIMHVFHLQMDQATAIFEEGLESGTAFIKEVPTLGEATHLAAQMLSVDPPLLVQVYDPIKAKVPEVQDVEEVDKEEEQEEEAAAEE